MFDDNTGVLAPSSEADLAALLCFSSSDEFEQAIRDVDQELKVTIGNFGKITMDLDSWRATAAEKYPDGLPKPFSSDPTQWLFNGHPAGADESLHVAVARLLGYQWPRQTGSSFPDCPALGPDGLEELADDDGIVPISPANREQPAAQRLRALLTAALGKFDERDLIRNSGPKGSTKTSLEEWLRDDFFAQHCAIFHSRPFLWHIWDGLKDGFHALVHYHRFDHAKLKTLTYTYLGDWIRDQKAASESDTPGAAERLGAAKKLQAKLIAILERQARSCRTSGSRAGAPRQVRRDTQRRSPARHLRSLEAAAPAGDGLAPGSERRRSAQHSTILVGRRRRCEGRWYLACQAGDRRHAEA